MKKIYNYLLIILSVSIAGCADDFFLNKDTEGTENRLVESKLSLEVGAFSVMSVDTRTDDPSDLIATEAEKKIDNIWVFQFDRNGNQLIAPTYYVISNQEELSNFDILLKEEEATTICVVANTNNSEWIKGRDFSTLEKYSAQTIPQPSPIQVDKDNVPLRSIPMEGRINATVQAGTSVTINVTRMYAKLKISFGSLTEGMTRRSIKLEKIPYYSRISPLCKNEDEAFEFPTGTIFGEAVIQNVVPQSTEDEGQDKAFIIYVPENQQGRYFVENTNKEEAAPINALRIEMGIQSVSEGVVSNFAHIVCPGANNTNDFNIKRNSIYNVKVNVSNNDVHTPSSNCFIVKPGQTISFEPYYREEEGGIDGSATDVVFRFSTYLDAEGSDDTKKIEYVQILWQTANAIGDNSDGSKVRYRVNTENPKYSKIIVETQSEGNALIGAFNKDMEIIWSWHIWITDNEPDQKPIQYWTYRWDGNGIYTGDQNRIPGNGVMSCNLGALADDPIDKNGENKYLRTYGMLYQWGRKDPFPPLISGAYGDHDYNENATGPHYNFKDKDQQDGNHVPKNKDGTYSEATVTLVDGVINPNVSFDNISGSDIPITLDISMDRLEECLRYSIKNPLVFFRGTNVYGASYNNLYGMFNQGDWLPVSNNKLWGGLDPKTDNREIMDFLNVNTNKIYKNYGTKKTIFDPCPKGWRVPPGDLWLGFTSTGLNPKWGWAEINYDNVNTLSEYRGMYMFMQKWRDGETLFFPTQGTRIGNGCGFRSGYCGNYHNATTDQHNVVNILHIHNDASMFKIFENNVGYNRKAVGGPIRCVRETTTL